MQFTAGPAPQTKQRFVYDALRSAVMRCQLQPGKRLIIEDIARELGVSPIPVREALRILQSEGLVQSIPHTGSIVAPISRESVVETFTVLEGLEVVATRAATQQLHSRDLQSLTSLLAEMDAAVQSDETDLWPTLNTRFHTSIVRVTGMPTLLEMTERMFDRWDRIRCHYFTGVLYHRIGRSQQEHHDIVRAMGDRDYARLEQLVKAHNRGALEAYVEHMSSDGEPRDTQSRD